MSLQFSPLQDVTTNILDDTPRIAFSVGPGSLGNDVVVQVATAPPRRGFLAGRIFVQTLGRVSEAQADALEALGVDPGHDGVYRLTEWDIGNAQWSRFIRHLRKIGAPIPEHVDAP